MSSAEFSLSHGNEYPYDSPDKGATRKASDAAHEVARGILADLNDRRSIKWALNDVDYDIRCEIIDSIAAIIRLRMQPIPAQPQEAAR